MAVTVKTEYKVKRINAWEIDDAGLEAIAIWSGATDVDTVKNTLVIGNVSGGVGDMVVGFADGTFEIWEKPEFLAVYELQTDPPI